MGRYTYKILLLLLLLFQNLAHSEDGAEEYMVIVLDEFPAGAEARSSGFVSMQPGQSKNPVAVSSGGSAIRVYAPGKQLQLGQNYKPGREEERRNIARTVAGISERYVPEIYFGARNSFSAAEYIDRMFLSVHYPLSNAFSAGLSLYGGIYDLLDNGAEPALSTGAVLIEAEGRYRFNPELTLSGGLSLGGTHSVVSPGIRMRLDYAGRGGVSISLAGSLWVPWDENTLAVYNDGRSSGLNFNLSLPFSRRFRLELNGGVDWRFTAANTFAASTFEGAEFAGGGRFVWDFLKKDYRQLPVVFQAGSELREESISSHLGIFAALQASEYVGRDEQSALIPVTQQSLDQRIGLSGEYVFTPHLAASAEFYVGFDPARKIDFGKLYGFNSRVIFVPSARLRIYGEFAMDSEAATGIIEGRTWYYGAGLNYKF